MVTRRQFVKKGALLLPTVGIFLPKLIRAQAPYFHNRRMASRPKAAAGGGSNVTIDTSTAFAFGTGNLTRVNNVTVGNNANRCLYNVNGTGSGSGVDHVISVVSDVSGLFTEVAQATDSNFNNSQVWRLLNPAVGAHVITVTFSGAQGKEACSTISLYNVNQTTPDDTATTANGSGTAPTGAVTLTSAEMAIGIIASDSEASLSVTTGTQRQVELNVGSDCAYSLASNTGTGSTSITWSQASELYSLVIVPVNAA